MKAIIMAAGKGSRIAELTNGKPKSFLKINDEELISRAVRQFETIGIKEILVVTGYQAGEIRGLLGDRVAYVHNPLFAQTNVLASFYCGISELEDDCIFLHADTIFSDGILNAIKVSASTSPSDIAMAVEFGVTDEEAMKVQLGEGNGKYISEINKTMSTSVAAGEFIGLAYIPRVAMASLRAAADELLSAGRFSEYFEAAVQYCIDRGQVSATAVSVEKGTWVEVDFVDDFRRAEKYFSKGVVDIAD